MDHLSGELLAEHVVGEILEGLELFFLLDWSHQGVAVSIFKEMFDQPPYSILRLDIVTRALLSSQCIFKVFFRGNGSALSIKQS